MASGGIGRTCLAWKEGMAEWLPVEQVIALPDGQHPTPPLSTTDRSGGNDPQWSHKVPKVTVLLIATLLVACALVSLIKRRNGPLPNRDDFALALATVHIASDAGGQIIIADKWNRTLVMEVRLNDYWDDPGYEIVARSDLLKIDYDDFANVASAASTDANLPPILDRNQQVSLEPSEQATLAAAVDTLVNWSITAVESKTTEIQRRVSGDDYSRYVFQGIRRTNQYILVYAWMPRLTIDDLNSSSAQPRGASYPVTDFAHAHLWKYLFDHHDEISARANAYYAKVEEEANKATARKDEATRNAQAVERDKADRAAADKAAEKSRLDQLFPAPPTLTPRSRP